MQTHDAGLTIGSDATQPPPVASSHPQHAQLPVTVHIMVYRNSQLLLLRRANTGYRDGWLSLPAGHLDGNEELCEAAARELWEETGLRMTSSRLMPVQVMHRREGRESVDFFLAASECQGEPINREPHKCSELVWFSPSELPGDVIPYIRRAVDNYQQARVFDSYGW